MVVIEVLLIAIAVICLLVMIGLAFTELPPDWRCKNLSEHPEPLKVWYHGSTVFGECPICKRVVTRDERGHWS